MYDEDLYRDGGGGHALFAPSDSPRWMKCSGGLLAAKDLARPASIYAATGSVAHSVAEEWHRRGRRPTERLGETVPYEGFDIEITAEMLDAVEEYWRWTSGMPGHQLVEQRVDFSRFMPVPGQRGTADHVVMRPHVLIVTDLKYGEGVRVFAENNSQLLLYALGVFLAWDFLYDFQEITIRVCQPRLDHYDEWTLSRDELMAFAGYARARAELCMEPNAPRFASASTCRFCPLLGKCPAHLAMIEAMADEGFADRVTAEEMAGSLARLDAGAVRLPARDAQGVSTARLARIDRLRRVVELAFAAGDAELERRALDGEAIPGRKLVHGPSSRKWKDRLAVARRLRALGLPAAKLYAVNFISPNQAEIALVKAGLRTGDVKQVVATWVNREPGKLTLADESDPRPAVVAAANLFETGDEL